MIDNLENLDILDNTLIYYIIGDNGAYYEMANINDLASLETPEFLMKRIDKLGGPESYNHYALGWAHAMDTPYQWTKQASGVAFRPNPYWYHFVD